MARCDLHVQTKLPPDRVIAALIDFSDRRPDVWPYLSRQFYEVREIGETTALVREGTSGPLSVWAVERYDWSTPGTVTWQVHESESFMPGYGLKVDVAPDGQGGSNVHIVWERVGKNFKGKFIVAMIAMLRGKPIASAYKKALDRLAS
jgi:hypothetical protein